MLRGMILIQAPENGVLPAVQKEFGSPLKQILLIGSSPLVQLNFSIWEAFLVG